MNFLKSILLFINTKKIILILFESIYLIKEF
jgi:hypothetical protein